MTDFLDYKGKRVVVSGCFSGMGEATARLLLDLGAEVHGVDYKPSTLPLASFQNVDLRERASIDAAVQAIGGRIDGLFNCAGLPQTFPAMEVMKVNFIGTRHLTEAVLGHMGEGGAIVSIASTGGLGWSRRVPVHMGMLQVKGFDALVDWCGSNMDQVAEGYAFSKEAVIVWTMMSSFHLIKRGVRINSILPGPTQTPMMKDFESATPMSVLDAAMQPINRRSTPQEQARPLVFLNSDAASYVNGVCLPVDGGFMAGLGTGQIDPAVLMGRAKAS